MFRYITVPSIRPSLIVVLTTISITTLKVFDIVREDITDTQEAVDLTLLSRYYERFGDHGVSVARRVRYLVTGERDGWLEGTVGEVVARGGQ